MQSKTHQNFSEKHTWEDIFFAEQLPVAAFVTIKISAVSVVLVQFRHSCLWNFHRNKIWHRLISSLFNYHKFIFFYFLQIPEQCANINVDAGKLTYEHTNYCDFLNTHTCHDDKIINENINNLHDDQRESHNFKPESSFSLPKKCLLGCNKHCKRNCLRKIILLSTAKSRIVFIFAWIVFYVWLQKNNKVRGNYVKRGDLHGITS